MFGRLNRFFSRLPVRVTFAIGLFLLFALSAVDYFTHVLIAFDALYLLPIGLVAWNCSRNLGLVISVCAMLSWFVGGNTPGVLGAQPVIGAWNLLAQSGIFLSFSLLVSSLKSRYRKMEELSSLDHLTGVANRRMFFLAATMESNRCQRYATPFSIAYIDVDDFKSVNDMAGHTAGDRLLTCIAGTLRAHTRVTDTVGRIGGDEFVVLLPESDGAQARQTVEKLHKQLLETACLQQHPVTYSIGVVTFTRAPLSVEEMLTTVDEVMYRVKRADKNSVMFAQWPEKKSETVREPLPA